MYLGSTLFNCYRIIIINMYYSQVFTEISRLDNLNSQNTLISLAIVRHLFWFKTALKPDVWLLPAMVIQRLNRFLIDASNQLKNWSKIQSEVALNTSTTGWPISIWTILWGCFEVNGWLKIKNFNSSEKFMQIPHCCVKWL